MIVDVEYNHLAHYPKEGIDDPFWQNITKFGRVTFPYIQMLDEKGYMRIGSTSSKPFILSDNIFEKHPRINHNVQIDGKIVGWIDVLCNSPTDYTEQDIQFIATFCRAISLEFQRQNYKIKQIDNSYVRALSYLFEGIDIQDAQIRQTLDFYRKKEMRENYSVLAIKPKKADASDEKR